MKNYNNLKEMIQYPTDGVVSKKIMKNTNLDVTLFCMSKGTEISDHTSTKEGTVYVVEGKGTFTLEGEAIEMTPGVLIYMKKSAVHSLSAEKDTSFVLSLYSLK